MLRIGVLCALKGRRPEAAFAFPASGEGRGTARLAL
jgi:hypothetical protein